jgi:glycosyltransferase involved in cell wall biosynthesis
MSIEKGSTLPKVLVVIPCYNEEISIGHTISEVKKHVRNSEVWVVDNCSKDKTAEVAQLGGARVINCPIPGKGFAVRAAFVQNIQNFDAILMIDGDDTYDLSNFEESLRAVVEEGYDMVVGERTEMTAGQAIPGESYRPLHSFGNLLFSRSFKIMFGVTINDVLSGYRLMSVPFVKSFAGGASKFQLETELNVHAYLIGAAVYNQKIGYRGRHEGSESKLNTFSDGLSIAKMQMKLFRSKKPLYYYSLTAIPWTVASLFFLKRALNVYLSLHTVPNFPSLIAGIGSFSVGVILLATGLILDKVRVIRVNMARYFYRNN